MREPELPPDHTELMLGRISPTEAELREAEKKGPEAVQELRDKYELATQRMRANLEEERRSKGKPN